jgi:hypothetical protein
MEAQLNTNTHKRIDSMFTDAVKIEQNRRFLRCDVSYVILNICDAVEKIILLTFTESQQKL